MNYFAGWNAQHAKVNIWCNDIPIGKKVLVRGEHQGRQTHVIDIPRRMLKFQGNTDNQEWGEDNAPNDIKIQLANDSQTVLFLNYFDIQISPGELFDPPADATELVLTEDTATVTTQHSHEAG